MGRSLWWNLLTKASDAGDRAARRLAVRIRKASRGRSLLAKVGRAVGRTLRKLAATATKPGQKPQTQRRLAKAATTRKREMAAEKRAADQEAIREGERQYRFLQKEAKEAAKQRRLNQAAEPIAAAMRAREAAGQDPSAEPLGSTAPPAPRSLMPAPAGPSRAIDDKAYSHPEIPPAPVRTEEESRAARKADAEWKASLGRSLPTPAAPPPRSIPTPAPATSRFVDVRERIGRHGGDSGKAADELRKEIEDHLKAGGRVDMWLDDRKTEVAGVVKGQLRDKRGLPQGLLPLAMGLPGKKSGVELHPVARSRDAAWVRNAQARELAQQQQIRRERELREAKPAAQPKPGRSLPTASRAEREAEQETGPAGRRLPRVAGASIEEGSPSAAGAGAGEGQEKFFAEMIGLLKEIRDAVKEKGAEEEEAGLEPENVGRGAGAAAAQREQPREPGADTAALRKVFEGFEG